MSLIILFIFNLLSFSYTFDIDFTTKIQVGKINSPKTFIPKKYYKLPVCKPKDAKDLLPLRDTIGDLFTGDSYYKSVFEIFKEETHCQTSCDPIKLNSFEIDQLKFLIDKEYEINFFIDSLPIGLHNSKIETDNFKVGIPIGYKDLVKKAKYPEDLGIDEYYYLEDEYIYYIYNHYTFIIDYNEDTEFIDPNKKVLRVVGASIEPLSIGNTYIEGKGYNSNCNFFKVGFDLLQQVISNDTSTIIYTYDITYRKSDIKYTSRWDHLLQSKDDYIHWKPIILSIVLILAGSLWVTFVFFRSVQTDIFNYNNTVLSGDFNPVETSWKQLCYDVFRPPVNRVILCSIIGTGVQVRFLIKLWAIFVCLMFLGYWGFLSPQYRHYVLSTIIIGSIVLSIFNGFFSAKFYRILGGTNWLINLITTALLLPSLLLVVIIITFTGFYFEDSAVKFLFRLQVMNLFLL